jgi:hypothetical protein
MPQAFVYENHVVTIPGWALGPPDLPLGYAYETADFNIHIFGAQGGWWILSPGLTFWKQKPLADWSQERFGATDVRPMVHEAGTVVSNVWRPGLLAEDQVRQALASRPVSAAPPSRRFISCWTHYRRCSWSWNLRRMVCVPTDLECGNC